MKEPIQKPTRQEALRIYRFFSKLKAWEKERAAAQRRALEIKMLQEACCVRPLEPELSSEPLRPLQWPSFLHWLDQEATCGVQQTYRRCMAALLRGIKVWREQFAASAEGISLGVLFLWTYPGTPPQEIARMLSWLGEYELDAGPRHVETIRPDTPHVAWIRGPVLHLFRMSAHDSKEQIRHPSPRLVDHEERWRLERIFHRCYAKGREWITPEDIAGGDFPDRQTQRMTLVATWRLLFASFWIFSAGFTWFYHGFSMVLPWFYHVL